MTYSARTHTEKKNILKAIVKWMIFISVIIFILMIIIPWLPICTHCKKPCAEFESDAFTIAAAIADYFSNPEHTDIKKSDIERMVGTYIYNPWTLTRDGDEYVIQVIDNSEKCPDDYQKRFPEWDSGRYTLKLK